MVWGRKKAENISQSSASFSVSADLHLHIFTGFALMCSHAMSRRDPTRAGRDNNATGFYESAP